MKMPVELVPPAASQARRGLFLTEMKKDQPPFANFGDRLGAAIGPLRFGGGLDSRRLQSGLADDVIASYSDRSAAIVVTTCGNGGAKPVSPPPPAAPAIESDLQSIDPSLLTGRLAGGRSVSFRPAGADAQTRDTAWAWIIATCAMLMLAELATLRIFRT